MSGHAYDNILYTHAHLLAREFVMQQCEYILSFACVNKQINNGANMCSG